MAIAGPMFSIVLGALFGAVYFVFRYVYPVEFISVPVGYLAYINVLLGIFNLIPGFPLDGGRVLRAIIWYSTKDLRKSTRIAASVGEGFGFVLILIGIFLLFRGDWGNGLWLMFIGWFLQQAAAGSYEQVIISQSLSALKASDMMTKDIVSVSSTIHLDELVHEWFMRYRFGRFPVVDGDQIYGIVTIHDVKSIPRDEWSTKNVLDIIKPISPDEIISSDEHASTVLGRMSSKGITEFLVISEKKLVGIITKSDILRALKLQRAFSDN
jgi:CBS domain-containing protein